MNCPHDGSALKLDKGKSGETYECPSCHCIFRFVIIKWYPKCYDKFHKNEYKPVKIPKIKKEKKVEGVEDEE